MPNTAASAKIAHIRLMLQRAEEVLNDAPEPAEGPILGALATAAFCMARDLGSLMHELDSDFCLECWQGDCVNGECENKEVA